MKDSNYWFRKMIVMMGEDPDNLGPNDTSIEGQKQIQMFKDFVEEIQRDAIESTKTAQT